MALFDLDSILLFGIPIVGGFLIGMGVYKLFSFFEKRRDRKKISKIIEGKSQNNIKFDGITVDVNKFIYKESDGKKMNMKLDDIVGTPKGS